MGKCLFLSKGAHWLGSELLKMIILGVSRAAAIWETPVSFVRSSAAFLIRNPRLPRDVFPAKLTGFRDICSITFWTISFSSFTPVSTIMKPILYNLSPVFAKFSGAHFCPDTPPGCIQTYFLLRLYESERNLYSFLSFSKRGNSV